MSTYITAIVAGPYEGTTATLTSSDGRTIDLGVYARASIVEHLDASKQERTITFDSYEEFERSQHACLIGVADYYPVQKLTYKGHDLDRVIVGDTNQAGMLRTFKFFV